MSCSPERDAGATGAAAAAVPTTPAAGVVVPGKRPADECSSRQRWRDLIERELPAAAARRPDWPIRLDHCFARVVLDAVYGRPWREAIPAPAWRRMDATALARAIALAEAIRDGSADLRALNERSLAWRGKR